jgi:cytochrome b561
MSDSNWRNTRTRYGRVSVALHWLMFLLIGIVYACMELRSYFPKGSAMREGMKAWHFTLGLCVLLLVLVRLAVRLAEREPAIQPAPPRWQMVGARVMHVALYGLMLAMPLTGWLTLSAAGDPIRILSLALPPLIGANDALADLLEGLHEAGGTLGYLLVGLHAAAALFHHYVRRDNTLRRMLPVRRE